MADRHLPHWLPRTDYYVNVLLLSLGTLACFFFWIGVYLLVPLGVWQLGISLVRTNRYGQRRYYRYLVLCILWFLCCSLVVVFDIAGDVVYYVLGGGAYALAVYAAYLARRSYVAARKGEEVAPPELLDHLL